MDGMCVANAYVMENSILFGMKFVSDDGGGKVGI
jgi:hypothetical protein